MHKQIVHTAHLTHWTHSVSQCTVHRKIVHSAPPGGHEGNTAFTPSYSHDGDDDGCDEEEEEEKKDIFEMKL